MATKRIVSGAALTFIILILFIPSLSFSENEESDSIEIKTGTSYARVTSMLGAPKEEMVTSEFWNNKKCLYNLKGNNYCLVRYALGKVKDILFLQNVSEEEVKEKFRSF